MLSVVRESDVRNEGIAAGREEAKRQKQERSEANNALIKAIEALINVNEEYAKIVKKKDEFKNICVGEQMEMDEKLCKDRNTLFRRIFVEDKVAALCLYNTLNESTYEKIDDLEVKSVNGILFLKMKNDNSYLIDQSWNAFEEKSYINNNLPLQGLLYFEELCRETTDDNNINFSSLVEIPTPKHVVFTSGKRMHRQIVCP